MISERAYPLSFIHSEIKESSSPESKKIISPEEDINPKIIKINADVDGCMIAGWKELYKSEKALSSEDLYAWFIEKRIDILTHLVRMIKEGKFDVAIVYAFTSRQSYYDDLSNGFQSGTIVPLLMVAYLESQCPGVKFLIDTIMVADLQATPNNNGEGGIKKAGDTFTLTLKHRYSEKKPQDNLMEDYNTTCAHEEYYAKHIDTLMDQSKRCLFYLCMHRPFNSHPHAKKIHSVFIDDREDILADLYDFAFLRSDLLPPGSIDFIPYSESGIGEIRHQQGTGKIDTNYIQTTRFLYLFGIEWHRVTMTVTAMFSPANILDELSYDRYNSPEKIADMHSSFIVQAPRIPNYNSGFLTHGLARRFIEPILNQIIPQLPQDLIEPNYINLSTLHDKLDFPLFSILGIPRTTPAIEISAPLEKSSTDSDTDEIIPHVIAALEENERKLGVMGLVEDKSNGVQFSSIDVAEKFCQENNLLHKEIVLDPNNGKYTISLLQDEKLKLIKNGELKEQDRNLKAQSNFILTVFATKERLSSFLVKYDFDLDKTVFDGEESRTKYLKKLPGTSVSFFPPGGKNVYRIHLDLSTLLHLKSQLTVLNPNDSLLGKRKRV